MTTSQFDLSKQMKGILPLGNTSEAVNAQTGTSYSLADGDRGKLVTFSNTSAVAVALPQAGASSLFIAGWFCDVENLNKGAVTITPTTSTINGLSSIVLLKGQGFRIVSDGTNYQIIGSYVAGTPSNTYVPTYNSTNGDVEWAAGGGGGGGVSSLNSLTGALSIAAGTSISVTPSGSNITVGSTWLNSDLVNSPDNDPASPTSYDDEFNGTTLSGSWSGVNTGDLATTPYSVANSGVMLFKKASTATISGYTQTASLGSSWTFETKQLMSGVGSGSGNGYPLAGMILSDGTKFLIFGFINFANPSSPYVHAEYWTTYSAFSSNVIAVAMAPSTSGNGTMGFMWQGPLWLRISLASGTITLSYSYDDFSYATAGTLTLSSYLSSITKIGIGCANNNNVQINPVFLHFRKIA